MAGRHRGAMQDFEFGGINAKFRGGVQKNFMIIRYHVSLREALLHGVRGAEAPRDQKNFENFAIF